MPDAAAAVLAIPELLEAILLQLPPHELLLAQSVNKSFFNAIQASKHIQRKLFFTAPPTSDDGPTLINPFLGRIVCLCSGDSCPWFRQTATDNYRIPDGHDEISYQIGDIRVSPFEVPANRAIKIFAFSMSVDSDILQHASFRKMLIASKACKFSVGLQRSGKIQSHRITTSSMTKVTDMLDIKWVMSMGRKERDAT